MGTESLVISFDVGLPLIYRRLSSRRNSQLIVSDRSTHLLSVSPEQPEQRSGNTLPRLLVRQASSDQAGDDTRLTLVPRFSSGTIALIRPAADDGATRTHLAATARGSRMRRAGGSASPPP